MSSGHGHWHASWMLRDSCELDLDVDQSKRRPTLSMPRASFRDYFRYLFPNIRERARTRFSDFRHDTWPSLKTRAQSRIYAAIVKHQQKKRRRATKRLFHTITADERRPVVDESTAKMFNYQEGSRRAKIAQGLSTLKKIGQDYQARRVGAEEYPDMPGAYPGVKVSRHENEELIIFPSYARPHVKSNRHMRQVSQEGLSDEDYWKREWDLYEDKNAVVDVDLRGWIYTNLKGPMNRRNRLLLTIARQLSGVPAPSSSGGYTNSSIADPNSHTSRHEQELANREVRHIEQRGQQEGRAAAQGRYSERPDSLNDGILDDSSGPSTPPSPRTEPTKTLAERDAVAKRESWSEPSEFTPEELDMANQHLLTRLRPFLTTPSMNTPLTIFYYNDETSQSRTTTTNEYGHFNFRAALNFIPTHVRVLAGEKLSATEEVHVTEPKGISLISDIDDTIKHSAITAGAREIFRNTFIRSLSDLTVDGVRQWYNRMTELGVKLHYVSNSPWQLYPTLMEYFGIAGLPRGSFHLKQYTGMLQGIFEPVAERKKGSLDRIFGDFPERRFILVGDSGEADLELYTDVAVANPKRVLAVFIRDVTTAKKQNLGFFNSSQRPPNHTNRSDSNAHGSSGALSSTPARAGPQRPRPALPPRPQTFAPAKPEEEDLIDLNDDWEPKAPARSSTEPTNHPPLERTPTSSTTASTKLPLRPVQSNQSSIHRKPAPPPPPKPRKFSSQQGPSRAGTGSESIASVAGVRNKLASIYNSLPSSPRNSRPPSRTTSPDRGSSGARFGEGSLAFTDDGNKTNDRPAPPLPPRRTGLTSYPAAAASYASSHLWSNGGSRPYTESAGPAMSKAEEMWKRRWLRSKEMLENKGIILRAWRTGSDVMEESVRLVENAQKHDYSGR